MKIRIKFDDNDNDIVIQPGDIVDFGKQGLLFWYAEPEAEAQRIMLRERQKRVQECLKFVREQFERDSDNS